MMKTELTRLMTWKRQCSFIFPYGSSIVPLLFSVVIIQAPTIALIYHIVSRELLINLLPALIVILNIMTLIPLTFCVCTDPGILPQIVNNYEWNEQLLYLPTANHHLRGDHSFLIVGVWGLATMQKYCGQCHIYRPTRTIHCKQCNHCVQMYDHHCPWLGVCIGKHNYKYFISFLVTINLQVMVMFGCCLSVIILSIEQSRAFIFYLLQVIVGALCFGFGLALFKLLVYHFGLINQGVTTNEDLKDTYKIIHGRVPFSRCSVGHPPLVNIRGKLIKSDEVEMNLGEDDKNINFVTDKGKRYSTLVSDRQSVLNSLVENQL